MNKNQASVLVVVAFAVVTFAAWLFLPSLQAASRAVDREASIDTERARRLLHEYSVALDYDAMLVQQLGDQGIDVDSDNVTDQIADDYQDVQDPLWKAYSPTTMRGDVATPAQPNYGDIGQAIREGLREQERRTRENTKLLLDALASVNQALAVSRGDVSARSDAEATRLKAIILYYQGMAERIRAELFRGQADQRRDDLAKLIAQAADAQTSDTREAEETVSRRIEEHRAAAAQIEKALGEDRTAMASLDEKIHDLEVRLGRAKDRVQQTQKALDDLRAEGVNLADPKGAEAFGRRVEGVDSAYRAVVREAQLLEFGGLPQATLQPPGDFLRGRFVEGGASGELTSEFGLSHYRHERAVLVARVEGRGVELQGLRDDVVRLVENQAALAEARRRGEENVKTLAQSAAQLYDDLNRVGSEAFAIEERAAQFFEQSAKASQAAARAADEWVSQGSTQSRDLSPESKERSAFNARSRDGWMGAHIAAQEADARLAIAAIEYDRFRSSSADADAVASAGKYFTLVEADPQTERAKAENAKQAGTDAITQAMAVLERAHSRAERNWTLVAQGAEATYLLAMFGRADYVPDAIEAYRKAVSGRESEPLAKPFMSRRIRMESK